MSWYFFIIWGRILLDNRQLLPVRVKEVKSLVCVDTSVPYLYITEIVYGI